MMKLFNTLSKAKEEFVPVDKKEVRLYTCGPTVYNFAHIGNFRTYIFEDLLRRWLKHQGFKVKQVMNLTDVEDKIIRDAQKEGISLKEFTERYTEAFFEDLQMLNVERVEFYPKATEEIKAMEALITCLLDKGIAYK
ncbi:MAG TPA: class I tRNA ligase family protein, partial [Candidatus Nanoarchaeia archaeon]|nr:class I tRNA ligase family protein [Candidatus Nanoarchaeia archaeon]